MTIPRLLVSVRDVAEARAALRGGCQILDIKEPRAGSLGMASEATLHEISLFVKREFPLTTLTAAFGEVSEYRAGAVASLPPQLDLVKLGCARLGQDPRWAQQWSDVRGDYSAMLPPSTGWVAVVYADWQLAEAPRPDDIITEAITAGCQGVLFDTFTKSSRRLLDWISVAELQASAARIHSAGMFLALAGSLRSTDLPRLRAIPTDIIAVRGAACVGAQRDQVIQEAAVRDLRDSIQLQWE